MAIVRQYVKQLDIPDEPGAWVKVRPLAWVEIQEATSKAYRESMQAAAELGEIQQKILDTSPEAKAAAQERFDSDPLARYDQLTVLLGGLVGWSYTDEDGQPLEVSEENIKLLDPDTAYWAACEIVGLHTKEALGNSSSPSTEL